MYALASRHRWPHWVFWALVGIVTINIYWLTIGARRNPGLFQFHLHFSTAMYFINRVWIAAMACRFFVESRRNHGLELMLTTPLEVGRIVMEDSCARLLEQEDIQEFYLGRKERGVRGTRRWKRKKTWR